MSRQSDTESQDQLDPDLQNKHTVQKDRYLDGFDGVLFALSFAITVFLLTQNLISDEAIAFICFVPLMVRRWIFGFPQSYPLKPGILWSILSIFGLLLVFTSMICFVFSWKAISDSHKKMPNFVAEVERYEAEYQSSMQDIHQLLNAVRVPAGTSPEEIKRLQDQKEKERRKEQKERIRDTVKAKQKDFLEKKQNRFNDGLYFLISGCLLCLLGSMLMNVRFDKSVH